MMLSKKTALVILLAAAQLGASIPVSAAGGRQPVHIRVYAFNSRTNSAVPSVTVHFEQPRTVPCPTGSGGSAVTGADGVADIYTSACDGPGDVFSSTTQQFEIGGGTFVHIVKGQAYYLVRLPMSPGKGNEGHSSELRTVHIRVRGREANGTLVPVHAATVYDEHGKQIATTDANGLGRAEISAPMGETVTMRANGGSKWRGASSSFIVGASEGGTRLTRADDYINFVLKPAEARSLIVEVLDHKTDEPISGASVSLYKPDHFPGTFVAASRTSAAGEAHFGGQVLDEADLNGETRIEASHKGFESAVQTVAGTPARYVVYLKKKSECGDSIVGTWDWWNGLTVRFSPGGAASYSGAQSGRGRWMHLGGNRYDVRWGTSRTYDYFSLSSDGTKIEGKFDGKPGTSTRAC